jgi:uncharacterized protein (DUF488 family)
MHTLYTLGYRAWTPAAFAHRVQELGAVVADIRYAPTSRHPAWRQAALRKALGDQYHHVHALGNANYKGGPVALVDLEAGLATLATLLEAAPVILLCACRDVDRCHRRVVAEAWNAHSGQAVVHLAPPAARDETLSLFPAPETMRSNAADV